MEPVEVRDRVVELLKEHGSLTAMQLREMSGSGPRVSNQGRIFDNALRALRKRRVIEAWKQKANSRVLGGPSMVSNAPVWEYRLMPR